MKRTALLDADTLVFEAATANEVATQWHDDLWTLHSFLDPAIEQLEQSIAEIKDALDADECIMTLSDYTDPWRRRVLPSYKRERNKNRKPLIFKPLREYLHEKYTTFQRPGLEGDDCLGVLLTNPTLYANTERVIVSIDKDMQTLPGLNVNLKKARENGSWFPLLVTEASANYFHMKQAVMGDATDGYGGVPGIGAVTATKLLAPFHDEAFENFDVKGAWKAIVAAYAKKGLSEEVALQNARVARICRAEDFDFDKKEVILWNPPQ